MEENKPPLAESLQHKMDTQTMQSLVDASLKNKCKGCEKERPRSGYGEFCSERCRENYKEKLNSFSIQPSSYYVAVYRCRACDAVSCADAKLSMGQLDSVANGGMRTILHDCTQTRSDGREFRCVGVADIVRFDLKQND